MKSLFLFLLLTLGITAFADLPQIFRDEDSGLVLEIPEDLSRTWNLTNCRHGIEFNIFESEPNGETLSIVLVAKLPSETFQDLYPLILDQLQQSFTESGLLINDVDENFSLMIEPCDSISTENQAQRYRLHICEEDLEEPIHIDVETFTVNNYLCAVLTSVFPTETDQDLEGFSKKVLGSIRFIHEE